MADIYCPLTGEQVEVHRSREDEVGDFWTCPDCKEDIILSQDRHLYHRPGLWVVCPSFEEKSFVWIDENEEYVCDACEAPIRVYNGVPLHSNVVEIPCNKYPNRVVVVPIDEEDHLKCPFCKADIDVQDHEAIHAGRSRAGTNRGRSAPPPPKTESKAHHKPPPASEPVSDEVAHARVLGLRGRVTFADIKRHYRERMMEYHPDKVAALGPKLREVAEHETKKINAAYEFFTAKYSK